MVAMLTAQQHLDLSQIERRAAHQTVLLIDDEPHVLASFARLLQGMPYELLAARKIEDAYELLAGQIVDVVISDQQLIGESGIDFFERIKQMYPRAARVLLTDEGSAALLGDAINKGAIFKYIAKPWRNEDMLAVLAAAFAHNAIPRTDHDAALDTTQR